jgi:hypothetical protein
VATDAAAESRNSQYDTEKEKATRKGLTAAWAIADTSDVAGGAANPRWPAEVDGGQE